MFEPRHIMKKYRYKLVNTLLHRYVTPNHEMRNDEIHLLQVVYPISKYLLTSKTMSRHLALLQIFYISFQIPFSYG